MEKGCENMNRSHSTIYRIFLLAAIALTIAGGIFYYVNVVEKKTTVTEGTLVWNVQPKEEAAEEKQILCSPTMGNGRKTEGIWQIQFT